MRRPRRNGLLTHLLAAGFLACGLCFAVGCEAGGGGGGGNANAPANENENDNTGGEAKNFAGAAVCVTCHSALHASWAQTLHAGAWATLKASDHMADSCIGCHVVGYGDGGFVDEATTPELADVQCESCHGPAGDHAASAGDASLRPTVSIASEVCGACHTGSHHPNFDQWAESAHAGINESVEEDLLAGGALVNVCGICHSGDVHYEAAIMGEEVADDGFAGLAAEDLNPITCVICHDPHARTSNAVMPDEGRDYQLRHAEVASPAASNTVADATDPSRFNLCGQCHHSRGRTWESTDRSPHHSVQSNMYLGEMPAPEGLTPLVANTVSDHSGAPAQCATCHMFRKDFESEEAPAISGHLFSVDLEACAACHPASVSDTLAALQDEVQTALDDIEMRLGDPATWQYSATGGPPEADDAEAGETTQADVSDAVKQVRFLWAYVTSDGSFGVHNPEYVRAMLAEADEILDGIGQ